MIVERSLDSWDHFKKEVITDQFADGMFLRGRFLFRGQGDAEWRLMSSFDRWYNGAPDAKMATANNLLDYFMAECEQHELPNNFLNDRNSWLGLAQHHGLPTRLLDWSESPYVAAMFAFAGHIRSRVEGSKMVAVCVIDTQSHIWSGDYGCEIITVPSYGNVRIANQYGKFSYLKSPVSSIEQYVEQFGSADETCVIRKYLIPASETKKAIGDLDAMGLNYSRIYPGLSGNAMAAEVRVGLVQV
ncbi:FRG domain-containing protein [Sphingomonas sp. CFBP9021]|uniref:FRG domain-containing protein n=1 Tax=Sphingomonas sp. CFBP9021 TaxID=3096534 RepID=UPI002A6AC8E2|nr:FRG domain-containing protein [Sphingomonas sp. CFBP9021]MDY0967585.1 FRG domain-containing protein [Sphingomonas sp. CFBP9021]